MIRPWVETVSRRASGVEVRVAEGWWMQILAIYLASQAVRYLWSLCSAVCGMPDRRCFRDLVISSSRAGLLHVLACAGLTRSSGTLLLTCKKNKKAGRAVDECGYAPFIGH